MAAVTVTITIRDCYNSGISPEDCAHLMGLVQSDVEGEYITLEEQEDADYASYLAEQEAEPELWTDGEIAEAQSYRRQDADADIPF